MFSQVCVCALAVDSALQFVDSRSFSKVTDHRTGLRVCVCVCVCAFVCEES